MRRSRQGQGRSCWPCEHVLRALASGRLLSGVVPSVLRLRVGCAGMRVCADAAVELF